MREFHYSWTYDLQATPEALWPLASDTNRFNRDTGLPAVELLGIKNGVRRIRFKIPFSPLEWDEEPFEWTYPYRFGILRRYCRGPMKEMRVDCRLERSESGGTRLTYQVWARPADFLGWLATPFVIGVYSAKRFKDTFHFYDRIAARGGSLLTPPKGWNLTQGGHLRYRTLSKRLIEQGVSETILTHLYEFLHRADDISVQRMRPYVLADAWQQPRRTVLEAFLRATRAGMLDMYWELLCPECRGVSEGHGHLEDVRGDSHCNTCNIDFKANFDHNVEVIFRPNPAVRAVDASVEFCVGSPQRQPHIILSLMVPAGEALPVDTMLGQGRYAFRASNLPGSQAMVAVPEGPDRVEVRAHATGWPYGESPMGLTPRIELINRTDQTRTFELGRTAWSDQAATAADVTALQVFRDLFASEVIRPGEEISVGSVTLMFTDLRGSTKLYREIGDAPAFGRVREHFTALEKAVAAEGGAVVKTMGDSVMAAFRSPAASLRAIWAAQTSMAQFEPRLWLKVGIHHGPCIVVNLNDRLDYFGSTVNVAARLPNFSTGGEIVFSEAIRTDPEVGQFLEKHSTPLSLSRFQTDVKGFDEPLGLWRLKL
jgi:class 3 adenylate cyclase